MRKQAEIQTASVLTAIRAGWAVAKYYKTPKELSRIIKTTGNVKRPAKYSQKYRDSLIASVTAGYITSKVDVVDVRSEFNQWAATIMCKTQLHLFQPKEATSIGRSHIISTCIAASAPASAYFPNQESL